MSHRPELRAVEELFAAALEATGPQRAALLESGAHHPALVAEVRALLAAHDAEGPLDRLASQLTVKPETVPEGEELADGALVGPYRVERPIARGGMGAVYLVRRADGDIDYDVALKVLRADLDTPSWHRRFLAERQVLARIGHRGIARLIDAGTLPDGRPWFAMEYVEGRPIVEYCERAALRIPDRIELFSEVCDAVAHAHRHLVVHRDIKPANVLVTDSGEVKLLDFGIAKLLEGAADEDASAHTKVGLRLMTPDYAAPEQLRGEPVTTATDVYQLGRLLQVVLTGSLPGAGDPSDSGEPTPGVHDAGRAKLRRDLRAIVDEATAPEPGRRYASVDQLTEDLRRYLDGMPVRARSGRAGYRVAKFVRRNAVRVTAAAAVAAMLVVVAVVSTVQARRTALERDRANEVAALLLDVFESAGPDVARGDPPDALELLEVGAERARAAAPEDPELAAVLFGLLADVHDQLGRYADAAELGERSLEAWRRTAGEHDPRAVERTALIAAAIALHGDPDSAEVVARSALERAPWRDGPRARVRAHALQTVAFAHQMRGDATSAADLLDSALTLYRATPGDTAREQLASALVNRAWLHTNAGRPEVGVRLMEESVEIRRELLDPTHPSTINSLSALALMRARAGDVEGALPLMREVVDRSSAYFGRGHPSLTGALSSYGYLLRLNGDIEAAEAAYREALGMIEDDPSGPSRWSAQPNNELGLLLLHERGHAAESANHFRLAMEAYATLRGPDDPWTAVARGNMASALLPAGRPEEAARAAEAAAAALDVDGSRAYLGPVLVTRGLALHLLGRRADAIPVLRRASELEHATEDPLRIARADAALGLVLVAHETPEGLELLRRAAPVLEDRGSAHEPLRDRVRVALASR